jgi:D-glucuronyl C5-epimerase C-terminus
MFDRGAVMDQTFRRATIVAGWPPALLAIFLLGDPLVASGAAATAAVERAEAPIISTREAQASSTGVPIPMVGRGDVRALQTAASAASVPWRTIEFTIRTLAPEKRFELRDGTLSTKWPPTSIHDRYGVPMRIINGYRRYHPVGLASLGLKYLANYRRTADPLYLDRAQRIASGLKRIGVYARNAIWFPYRHTFTMHGDANLVNRPPWYSGMAQGLALALFVRLWEQTRADRYQVLADQTYNSLRNLGRASNPWVSRIDGGRYLWIEEYPQQLDRTFNGYVFALYGLYDYYQLTKNGALYPAERNASALALLRGGITTIRAFASTFRNPGGVSDYCLAHHYRNPNYHPVHIRQLRHLALITSDPWFTRMANNYAADVS